MNVALPAGIPVDLYAATGITAGTRVEIAAPIYAFGPSSQQSRGSIPSAYASNRIFDEPNTEYLLVIESLDPQSQYVSSRLELYEGGLDLLNQDYA